MKIKYIGDDPNRGIQYDWKYIRREYKKLKIPDIYFNPLKADLQKAAYYIAMSDRVRGKTTETVILGMLLHKHYGTIIHYIRNTEKSIRPYNLNQLFPVIVENGYVERLTDGQYNDVYYYGHKWFYCRKDENGKRVETAPKHFMICMHLNESDDRKSSYNCPTGDIIIFDEFIEIGGYGYNDYLRLNDLMSTIFRLRECCFTFLLSNTVDKNSPWFDEFCIRDAVNTMQLGTSQYIESELGSWVFVEIMEPNKSEQALNVIRRYFGFKNPKLAAITGKGWITDHYQHIPEFEDPEAVQVICRRLYIKQSGKMLRLQLVRNPYGLCVYVLPATKTYQDSIILTHGDITDPRYQFGFGRKTQFLDMIWRLYKGNQFYYLTNSEGALLKSYIQMVYDKNKKMCL